jgi:hypothetical protein
MFTVIKPQKVVHSDGYTIQIADRETVEYIEHGIVWQISVDFGKTVGIYRQSIRRLQGRDEQHISQSDKDAIVEKVAKGLQAMGSQIEII